MNAPRLIFLTAVVLGLLLVPTAAQADTWSPMLTSVGPLAGAGAHYSASFEAASDDGSRVFFTTNEQLVPQDHNSKEDVYVRSGAALTLISGGVAGQEAQFDHASADGSRVVFTTEAALAPGDTDNSQDVYEWHNGSTTLVSDGPSATDPEIAAQFYDASRDGTHIFFSTAEAITADDHDSGLDDVFDRSGGQTERITVGEQHDDDLIFIGFAITPDGTHAYFVSGLPLTTGETDTNNYGDLYQRYNGHTTLISVGAPGQPHQVSFRGVSDDGTKVAFETDAAITSDDDDPASVNAGSDNFDVYLRSNGSTTTLVTPGPSTPTNDNSSFLAANSDFSSIAFVTRQALTSADTDPQDDIYIRHLGGTPSTELVSVDSSGANGDTSVDFEGATPDLSHIFFQTTDPLVPSDTDDGWDIYERSGSTTSLVTTGPADDGSATDNAYFGGASADGTRVFFTTDQKLVPADNDGGRYDVYERANGVTTLVSPGPSGAGYGNDFVSSTADGNTVFIESQDPLTCADTHAADLDVYAVRRDAPAQSCSTTPAQHPPAAQHLPAAQSPDRHAPLLKLARLHRQRILRQHGVIVTLTAGESATAKLTGTVSVPGGGAKVYRFKGAKRALAAGKKTRVKLRLGKRPLRRIAKALKHHRKLRAKVTVVLTDAAGNKTAKKLTIALKR